MLFSVYAGRDEPAGDKQGWRSKDGGARMEEQGRRRKGANQGWNDQDNEGGNGGNDGDEDNRDGGK